MKAQFSQDHIAPVPIQPPAFQLHIAERATQVVESPASQKADPDSSSHPQSQAGISSGGAEPGPPEQLPPNTLRAKNRLEAVQSTLHQLSDLVSGLSESVSASGYNPSANRNNQRLLKGAVSIAKEILSHAENDGEPLFRIQTANLYSKSASPLAQRALAAYGQSPQYTPPNSADPPVVRQALNLVQLHVNGSRGILAALQDQADNGPFTTDRVKRALNDAQTTLQSLESVVGDLKTKLIDQAGSTRINLVAQPLNQLY